ncbi:MAG: YdiU family protein [Tissierellia bacterium]|nr:YdiU family protein [Tissierellia bacterium]
MELRDIGWNIDNSYITLPKVFYSKVKPNPVKDPKLVILNEELALKLGLDVERLKQEESLDIFAGNRGLVVEELIAQAYAGHQFGHFTMLGDGRAMLLGEHITPSGQKYDIQLKGAGKTPYSRGGDGRAALGPMLREYIISEGIYHLNNLKIPTSRSLAIVTTGEKVYREIPLEGAILTRVAKSHIRVGTFEYAARYGNIGELKALADYTIGRHFPSVADEENIYLGLLREVIQVQAALIASWQLIGFIHGVMNTDNMTISGETIDYGPCAFMNTYDPNTVFSSIDRRGRYAYGNQPNIGGWNLARFAETLVPLIGENEDEALRLAKIELDKYEEIFNREWLNGMRLKLGLSNEEPEDQVLVEELLFLMEKHKADFTNTFVALTDDRYESLDKSGLFQDPEFIDWKSKWNLRQRRQNRSEEASLDNMKKYNPTLIPRNHQVEKALAAAVDNHDYTVLDNLVAAIKDPFNYEDIKEEYMTPPDSSVPYKTYCGT